MSIYVQPATESDKLSALGIVLRRSGFYNIGEIVKRDDPIVIKVNLAPISQRAYKYGTDPVMADAIVDILHGMGFTNVSIVEAEGSYILVNNCYTPDVQAKMFGYRHPVVDLTKTKMIPFIFGHSSTVLLSDIMVNAKFIINVPKPKNHDLMLMTGCLKNMYGSIPTPDKWHQFHRRQSGLGIEEVTYYVNKTTPVDFNVVDFIEPIDGDEVSLFKNDVDDFSYYPANRIVTGTDPLAIDKYLSTKMGYGQNDSPIVAFAASMIGDYDIDGRDIIGDDLEPFSDWRRISGFLNWKAKTQDKLAVSEGAMRWGLKQYHFDACPIDTDEERHEKKKDDDG